MHPSRESNGIRNQGSPSLVWHMLRRSFFNFVDTCSNFSNQTSLEKKHLVLRCGVLPPADQIPQNKNTTREKRGAPVWYLASGGSDISNKNKNRRRKLVLRFSILPPVGHKYQRRETLFNCTVALLSHTLDQTDLTCRYGRNAKLYISPHL